MNHFALSNPTGFLKVSTLTSSGQTDQALLSRKQLIKLCRSLDYDPNPLTHNFPQFQDALQYLTHFSRDLNQPSFIRLQSTDSTKTL